MSDISQRSDLSHLHGSPGERYFCPMFSKTFGYALRAVTFLAIHGNPQHKISLQELSESLDIPRHFLGKVMQDLVRNGIVDSIKGPSGGFYANEGTRSTPLIQILRITDGNLIFDQCALNIKRCNAANPCPLHDDFAICRDGMLKALAIKTVGILAEEVISGQSYLAR